MTPEHDTFDLDDWGPEDALGIARVRYLMGLVVLPYVCRYVTHTGDLGAVVDDATMLIYQTHEPGTPLDIDAFVKDYIERVEGRRLGRRARTQVGLERVWTRHATALRGRTRGHRERG
jgi:hypothetical protein